MPVLRGYALRGIPHWGNALRGIARAHLGARVLQFKSLQLGRAGEAGPGAPVTRSFRTRVRATNGRRVVKLAAAAGADSTS